MSSSNVIRMFKDSDQYCYVVSAGDHYELSIEIHEVLKYLTENCKVSSYKLSSVVRDEDKLYAYITKTV